MKTLHRSRGRRADAAEFKRYKEFLDKDLTPRELLYLEASCPHLDRAKKLRIVARCLEQEATIEPGERQTIQRANSARTIAIDEQISERQVVRIHTAWRKGRLREVWKGWVNRHEGAG